MSFRPPTGGAAPRGNVSGYNVVNTPQFTPQQMQLFQQLLGGISGGGGIGKGLDYLSGLAGGDEEAFGKLEAPAYRAFQGQLGQIGSRFAGLGALDSSAFQNATSGAASEFAENLGAQRHGIQQNAIDKLLGLSERVLGQRPYETSLEKKPDWSSLLGNFLGQVGGGFASGFGGQAGQAGVQALLKALGIGG